MTTIKDMLACPICHEADFLQANVMQSVDVTVSSSGDIHNGFDFSDPEIDESGELYCSNCGTHLWLSPENERYQLIVDE